jgi:hypothetical protein
MKKWNPYNVSVTNEWAQEFASKRKIPIWFSRICLHIGLFMTNVSYLFHSNKNN